MTSKEALEAFIPVIELIESLLFTNQDAKDKLTKGLYENIAIIKKNLEVLEKYHQIEQELGIDLITLFKALDDGIYVSEQNAENEIVWEEVVLNIHNKTLDFKYPRKEIGKGRPLSMFGKTWALTRGELEK